MEFPLSRAAASVLEILAEAGSTNDELVRARPAPSPTDWPDLSVVATDNQTRGSRAARAQPGSRRRATRSRSRCCCGRGRPAGDGLRWTARLVPAARRPRDDARASARSCRHGVGAEVAERRADRRRKVCGILAELLPDARASSSAPASTSPSTPDELPVDTATSLAIAGASADRDADALLAAYLASFAALYRPFLAAGGDAGSQRSAAMRWSEACETRSAAPCGSSCPPATSCSARRPESTPTGGCSSMRMRASRLSPQAT